jgi:hypothetical protein
MQVHILSFEGPDAYARADGLATRVTGLAAALAAAGCETHLWFIGDPELPGHETCGRLRLHRWCQQCWPTVGASRLDWSGWRPWPWGASPVPGRLVRTMWSRAITR